MNRRNFLRTGAAGLLLPVAPAIFTSKGVFASSVTAFTPRFNFEPMMLANALMQSEHIARQVRFADGDIDFKKKRLAEIKIEQAKLHLKMVQSIADNPGRPFRMDVMRGVMW